MATSYITNGINDLLDKIGSIPFDWNAYIAAISDGMINTTNQPDLTKLFQILAVWNNQPRQWRAKKGFPSARPCCFVQPIPGKAQKLGQGITLYPDFIFRIHIIDFQADGFYEAGGTEGNDTRIGGLDQNLEVFEWRDMVKAALQLYAPPQFSAMTLAGEYPDEEHDELYHYVLDFRTSFADLKGSIYDADQLGVIALDPPLPAAQFGYEPSFSFYDEQVIYASPQGYRYVTQSGRNYKPQNTF